MPGHHDVGGLPAGPIDRHEHEPTALERRIDALCLNLCGGRRVVSSDLLRRVKEDMDKAEFDSMTYYERWCVGAMKAMIEKGILTENKISARIAQAKAERADG